MMHARSTFFLATTLSLLFSALPASATIIETLIGDAKLAPLGISLENPGAATAVDGVLHVAGRHQGRAARQLVDLATGGIGGIEFFDSIASAQGATGDPEGLIREVTQLDDGRVMYMGQSFGTGSNEPTYWFEPNAPIHPLVGGVVGQSGEIRAAANDGTFVGTSGFVSAVVGDVASNAFQGLPGFDPLVARDITFNGQYIAGGGFSNFIWSQNELGGYDVFSTGQFDFSESGGDAPQWSGVAIDPIVGDAVFAGTFFDLTSFSERVGFWRADGTFIGATEGAASFKDFEVWEGQLVAAVSGLDDSYLVAISDFSSIALESILGVKSSIFNNGLFVGSAGFLSAGPNGSFVTTRFTNDPNDGAGTEVPEPMTVTLLGGALLVGLRQRKHQLGTS